MVIIAVRDNINNNNNNNNVIITTIIIMFELDRVGVRQRNSSTPTEQYITRIQRLIQ